MLRQVLKEALHAADQADRALEANVLRLVMAAIKDRDACERDRGNADGVDDVGIRTMMESMIQQRRKAIQDFEQDGRIELAEQERLEMAVLERFFPRQLGETEISDAVDTCIKQVQPNGVKEVKKVMASLRKEYDGRMDFTKAASIVRDRLAC